MEAWSSTRSLASASTTKAAGYASPCTAAGAHSDRNCRYDDALDAADPSDDGGIDINTQGEHVDATNEHIGASPAWQHSASLSDAVECPAVLPTGGADDGPRISPKRFTRKRRGSTPDNLVDTSCGRCKSNLNGKLIVQCASCSFRRHLYCFSPPLKQHPAFAEHVNVTSQGTKALDSQLASDERAIHPVQAQWQGEAPSAFDWYAFREEKAKAVGASASSSGDATASPTKLVYYSKPFADMKATALSWRERVVQHKRVEQERAQRELKKRLPPKRDVMLSLTERELELIERTLMRRQREAEMETALFDDTRTYDFDMSLERIRRLREPRQSVVCVADAAPSARADLTSIALMLNEIAEAVALSLEDADVLIATVSAVADSDDVGGIAASKDVAVVLQTACIRWKYKTTRRRTLRQQREAAERQRLERSARASASVRRLQFCIRFIMLLVRNVRNAHVKKELLLTLQTSSEDSKVANAAADDAERKAKLAQRRIERFFLRRVRPYICLKKRVMSRRIVRWWKRKFLTWKWRAIARDARHQHRERASRAIQRAYRRFRTKCAFAVILEKHALRKIKAALRSWLMARVIKKERMRAAIYATAASFGVVSSDTLSALRDAPVDAILFALGNALYSIGALWSAAAVLKRAWKLNPAGASWSDRLALAYAHHMAWHSSYDPYNLAQAYEMYCVALNDFAARSPSSELSAIDPFILQDTAVVMMQMKNFGGSLRMLAHLIERFPQYDGFPLWLLLAAVQLQQRGEWTQSVEYLTYLQDIPPSPYLERDILSLCAIALERERQDAQARSASKEAWSAAIRQWSLAQKAKHVLQKRDEYAADRWNEPGHSAAPTAGSRLVQSTHRKWELLRDFAQRAATQGHYLLACRLMLYMLEIRPDGDDAEPDAVRSERASVWWSLADVFRHLGHLDLYVDATARSYLCVESDAIGPDRRIEWRRDADVRARSFRDDVENLSTLELLEKLCAQFIVTPEA